MAHMLLCMVHVLRKRYALYPSDTQTALIPKEGDDILEQVDEFGAVHLNVPIGPAKGIADEATDIGILCRLVEVLDPDRRARKPEAEQFPLGRVQCSGVIHVLPFDPLPDDTEGLSFFQEKAAHAIGIKPFLAFGRCRDVNPVQQVVVDKTGYRSVPGIPGREIEEEVLITVLTNLLVDITGNLEDVIGLVTVDLFSGALSRVGFKDLVDRQIVVQRGPFLTTCGQVGFAEVLYGEFECFIVDDLDRLAFPIPKICSKQEGEGGFSAASLRSEETECFHDLISLKSG